MKNNLIILFLISLLTTCCQTKENSNEQANKRVELVPEPDKHLRLEYDKIKELHKMSNDSIWKHLIFQKGGCLTGGQYIRNDKFGNGGCVMSNSNEWEVFFTRDKKEISDFLINKISNDTLKTNIHTCPFFSATESEIAVYSLQKMYKINWYDFNKFNEFKNKEITGSKDNHQSWLQGVLKNKYKRKLLKEYWTKKASG